MSSKIKKIVIFALILSFAIAGTACTMKDISIEKPESESSIQEESTAEQSIQTSTIAQTVDVEQTTDIIKTIAPAQVYPIIARPNFGEQFPVTSLVKSGTLLATVNSAEVYTNLYEAGANWEDMFIDFRHSTDGISSLQVDYFDRQSGDFLESKEFGKTAFVVVELTLENHDAVSVATELNIPGTPKIYPDDVFRIDILDICPLPEKNAEDPNNIGNNVPLLWCSMVNTNPEIHPFAVSIPNGEFVTLKIGTMVQQTVFDEATQKKFGGHIGDDLLSRLYLTTSMSTRSSMVYLELDPIS